MPKTYMSTLTLLVDVNGTKQNVEFTLKDAEARQMIEALGNAVKWIGATSTALTDGATTSPITINGQSVTPSTGDMTQYDGEEFIWNGSAWQSAGKNNFGDMAFANTASGSVTPAGSVAITAGTDTTDTVTGVTANAELSYFTQNGEAVSFNPGALMTLDSEKMFLAQRGADSAAFTGTQATVQVSPDSVTPPSPYGLICYANCDQISAKYYANTTNATLAQDGYTDTTHLSIADLAAGDTVKVMGYGNAFPGDPYVEVPQCTTIADLLADVNDQSTAREVTVIDKNGTLMIGDNNGTTRCCYTIGSDGSLSGIYDQIDGIADNQPEKLVIFKVPANS